MYFALFSQAAHFSRFPRWDWISLSPQAAVLHPVGIKYPKSLPLAVLQTKESTN